MPVGKPACVCRGGGPLWRGSAPIVVRLGREMLAFFLFYGGETIYKSNHPAPKGRCTCACVSSWSPDASWKGSLNPNPNSRSRFPSLYGWGFGSPKDKIVSECLSGQFMVIMRPNEVVRKIKCYLPKKPDGII